MAASLQRPAGGIVLVDKPQGLSSNQVLGRIKRLYGIKKAGHTGTLDPMATGLLVVCLGYATRVCGHLLEADKAYQAKVHLGVVTDTEDGEGEVIETHPVPPLDARAIAAVLDKFVGQIEQVPPMYSALKHGGQRLYRLARLGQVVDRPPRQVRIDAIAIDSMHLEDPLSPGFSVSVQCSKGTYIRSLVRDIGEQLGCGAHLSALRRTQAQPFDVCDAHTLEALEEASDADRAAWLLPIDRALPDWPVVDLRGSLVDAFRHGQVVPCPEDISMLKESVWVCVKSGDAMLGLAQIEKGAIQPRSVFV